MVSSRKRNPAVLLMAHMTIQAISFTILLVSTLFLFLCIINLLVMIWSKYTYRQQQVQKAFLFISLFIPPTLPNWQPAVNKCTCKGNYGRKVVLYSKEARATKDMVYSQCLNTILLFNISHDTLKKLKKKKRQKYPELHRPKSLWKYFSGGNKNWKPTKTTTHRKNTPTHKQLKLRFQSLQNQHEWRQKYKEYILFFPTRHETWTVSQNNSKFTLWGGEKKTNKNRERQWSNTKKFEDDWTLQCLAVTGQRLQQYLVKLTSSRPQPGIWVPSPLHPHCFRAVCPMTISSSWSTDIQNIVISSKANSEIFSNQCQKKKVSMLCSWGLLLTETLHFILCCIFSRNSTLRSTA